jgi:hypothetical protein
MCGSVATTGGKPMSRSTQSGKVDEVQAAVHEKLRGLGFRRHGRTFNRTTEDGLVHVVNLQMGAHDPPGTVHVPFLRENLWGRFTVNLGVYVPEVARHHGGGEAKKFVQEHQCCVRRRLGDLGPEGKDLWWRNDAAAEVVPDLLARLERDGLPFLARFASRDAVLNELRRAANGFNLGGPPRVVMAIIHAERGETDAAGELLAEQAKETGDPRHAEYVRSLATRLRISLDV